MSQDPKDEAKKLLRKFLNKEITGKNVDAVLEGLAQPGAHLIKNVQAVNDSMYIVTAEGRYLDQRLADRDFIRPGLVGLDDEVFRELGIAVTNRKQVRDLINGILEVIYGVEYTRGSVASTELEPYALNNGDDLIMQLDDGTTISINFDSSQFVNISAATAQEVSDAIVRELKKKGIAGSANPRNDGAGNYVVIFSPTTGPSSTVRVKGGRAQRYLKFPSIRPTTGDASTQWTLSLGNGGVIRATWTAGSNPSTGKIKTGDYAVITGSGFNTNNRGTFTITKAVGGLVGAAYVEFLNPLGVSEVVLQGATDNVLFFEPTRFTLNSNLNYAAAYQTKSGTLEVYMPAVTRVVRRNAEGAAHLKEDALPLGNPAEDGGFYVWDITKGYTITKDSCLNTQPIDGSTESLIFVDNSTPFPDSQGFLVVGFGTAKEEGPVPYIAVPSTNTIQISPSYRFKNSHDVGTDIALVGNNFPFQPSKIGLDYPMYITDTVSGRLYAESLINEVAATGINVIIYILYPNDEGLGSFGTAGSEKTQVWGV
jgi:hypothetical protein